MESAPTEIVGSIHVISQLSEQLLRLGKKCHVLIEGISGTYWEIDEFGRMFSAFSDNLYLFQSEIHELQNQNCPIIQENRIRKLVSDVLKLSKSKIRPIKDALRQLQALRDDESFTSLVKAKIKWAVRDRQNLRKLLIGIEPVRLHILQLAKIFRLHLCYSEIQRLRSELKCIPAQLTMQLKTLNKWNRRLRRECQTASRRYEEHCASISFTPSEAKELLQNDALNDFMNSVQEVTQEEYAVSQNLLAELEQTSDEADSETTSVSNKSLDSHRSRKAVSLRFGFDDTTGSRRHTDSTTTRPSTAKSHMSYSSTVSLNMESVPASRPRIQHGRLTTSAQEAPPNGTEILRPDALHISHKAGLEEIPSRVKRAPSTNDILHSSSYQASYVPDTSSKVNDIPPEPFPDQAIPIEGTQNWFEVDPNGGFSIDQIPIRKNSTTADPGPDDEGNEGSEDDDAASSRFAPSSMYNCMSTSSVSVEYHRDGRSQAPPIFISESQSVAMSDVPSVSSWEDWAESEIAMSKRALSIMPDEDTQYDRHESICRSSVENEDELGADGDKTHEWCQDLAHAIFRIEAEKVSGRCPCDECMKTHQLHHPDQHRRGVQLLM